MRLNSWQSGTNEGSRGKENEARAVRNSICDVVRDHALWAPPPWPHPETTLGPPFGRFVSVCLGNCSTPAYAHVLSGRVAQNPSQLIRHMSGAPTSISPLDLNGLGESPGMPGLTRPAGQDLADAAALCFEECGHREPITLKVTGWKTRTYQAIYPRMTDQKRRTYNDQQEATEKGACAVAICVIHDLAGFAVVERSRTGTGFDYWLGDDDPRPFQKKARLEVSGILHGTENDLQQRVKQKCRQTERSDHTRLEAFVAVIEFGHPMAKVVKR